MMPGDVVSWLIKGVSALTYFHRFIRSVVFRYFTTNCSLWGLGFRCLSVRLVVRTGDMLNRLVV